MSLGGYKYLILFSLAFPLTGFSQTCDCPAATTCSTCSGGISSLTLEYKGASAALITAKDNSTTVFSQTLSPGAQFTVVGPPPNGKFNGSSVDLSINGVFNVSIDANCTLIFDPNAMYGSFGLISAKSLTGGELCCTTNSGDTDPPVITGCPLDVEVTTTECFAIVNWDEPVATDCALKSLTSSVPSGTPFPIGETTVVYTATDVNNNQDSCSFKVRVIEKIAPIILNCPENIDLTTTDPSGQITVDWTPPTATDNCSTPILTSTHNPGDLFQEGPTEVLYTATDSSGNTDTCIFIVTVTVEKLDLDISGVVTPDGNHVNDEWVIGNIENYEKNKVVIVDRWGGVVYRTSGYNNTSNVWDGRNTRGNILPTGTYFFTISVRMGASTVEKKGFIELIR